MLLSTKGASCPVSRWFVTFFAGVNLFWFAGYVVHSGALNVRDLLLVARDLGWIPAWRPLAIVVGTALYIGGGRLMTDVLRDLVVEGETARNLYCRVAVPYIAGVLSAACAGLLWRKDPWGGTMEAMLAVGLAPAGLCLATWRAGQLGWRLHRSEVRQWTQRKATRCYSFPRSGSMSKRRSLDWLGIAAGGGRTTP